LFWHSTTVMTFDDTNIYYSYLDNNTTYPVNIRRIVAVDINTGNDRWTFNLNRNFNTPNVLTAGGGKVFFVVDNVMTMETTLYALDGTTSAVEWTTPLYPGSAPNSHTPVYSNGKIFIDMMPSNPPQTINAFDANTGLALWKYNMTSSFGVGTFKRGAISVNNDSVIILDQNGNMIALNKDSGQVRWNIFYADRINFAGQMYIKCTSMPVILTSDKVFIENNGKIKIFNAGNGSQLNVIAPANLKIAPLVIGGGMLIATDGTNLYSFIGQAAVPTPASS
jgi:outer membrane protein assembly factor BamB